MTCYIVCSWGLQCTVNEGQCQRLVLQHHTRAAALRSKTLLNVVSPLESLSENKIDAGQTTVFIQASARGWTREVDTRLYTRGRYTPDR